MILEARKFAQNISGEKTREVEKRRPKTDLCETHSQRMQKKVVEKIKVRDLEVYHDRGERCQEGGDQHETPEAFQKLKAFDFGNIEIVGGSGKSFSRVAKPGCKMLGIGT